MGSAYVLGHPPPLSRPPNPHQSVAIGNRRILGANGTWKFFSPLVKGLDNWLHPMCVHPKCSN